MSTDRFWRSKLAALLHDPPDKCLNISDHEAAAQSFQAGAGLIEGKAEEGGNYDLDAVKAADHFTAAADRFAFPKIKCSTIFSKQQSGEFIHPLSSARRQLEVVELLKKSGHLHGVLQSAINGIDTKDPRTALFLYWRRWLENAVLSDHKLARECVLFPADSRIPDHSIWVHNAMASALAGCVNDRQVKPTLLLFQLGGVQDFIAQARSTRDLWSGSYLLSWLMAQAMKAISDEVGPDSIVFPNLRGNGIFDALHRDSVYAVTYKNKDGENSLWERILEEKDAFAGCEYSAGKWLLTPTLPNRFLALLPTERAAELAKKAEAAIHAELRQIGEAVWQWVAAEASKAGCSGMDNWKLRWDAQLRAFPQTSWALQPWLPREECLQEMAKLPINQEQKDSPLATLQNTLRLAEEWIEVKDRDARYYKNEISKTELNNSGIFWSAHYALLDAKLAARRNTNLFSAWENPWPEASLKDSLSGKEEIIGDEDFWRHIHKEHSELFASGSHKYAAMNLIKRLWCRDDQVNYLRERLGLTKKQFKNILRFDSVEDVTKYNLHRGKYVAVLAMDGDEMGKWVSGQKTPRLLDQLSVPARQYLEEILREHQCSDLRRLLTPSYHLQFSEALANFATWLAGPIVESHGGQLIYAGGDDVLAMLPADRAVACAQALRTVFRGEEPENMAEMRLNVEEGDFVTAGAGYPLLVPGKQADVSVGLAIGHYQAPLQTLVKEAQNAERRAKQVYGRGAIAFSLYKRSGETLQWGCKWGSKALPLMKLLDKLSNAKEQDSNADKTEGVLSGRFPYALAGLLQPYQLERKLSVEPEEIKEIIACETEHVISRQGSELLKIAAKNDAAKAQLTELRGLISAWLEECVTAESAKKQLAAGNIKDAESLKEQACGSLVDFIQPFLTETFINRGPGGEA